MSGKLTENDGAISNGNEEAPDTGTGKYGRRALILGAAAAGAVGASVLKSSPADAGTGNGGVMNLGVVNTCSGQTEVDTTSGCGLAGTTTAAGESGVIGTDNSDLNGDVGYGGWGVYGQSHMGCGVYGVGGGQTGSIPPDQGWPSGVTGDSADHPGVYGVSNFVGVWGVSNNGNGGQFQSNADDAAGVYATGQYGINALGNTIGVYARPEYDSGLFNSETIAGVVGDCGAAGPGGPGDGVLGLSNQGNGVHGVTDANGQSGVYGVDQSSGGGVGVYATSEAGNGVHGKTSGSGQSGVWAEDYSSGGGYGLYCYSVNGVALRANGVASFARSGLVSIGAGEKSTTVTDVNLYTYGPGENLGGNPSLVLANLQNSLTGVYVESVVPDLSASSFTIYLSKAVPHGHTAQVGWFVVN